MKIIVNGQSHDVKHEEISYEKVCELVGLNSDLNPSMTYSFRTFYGVGLHGILHPKEFLLCNEGTVFNVAYTGGA